MRHGCLKLDWEQGKRHARILDLATFHDAFARAFGFPGSYGRNLDAWIDCMTRLDEVTFSDVSESEGSLVMKDLKGTSALKMVAPQILAGTLELAVFVKWRCVEMGGYPNPIVSYCA